MEINKTCLYQDAVKIWKKAISSEIHNIRNLKLSFEPHKKLLNISQAGHHYYMIFNVIQMELELISVDIKNVTGYSHDEINASFFLDLIHPDDKPYFLNYENMLTEFFNQLPLEKRASYKCQHDYRIKTKTNNYIRLLHQIVPLEFDENNYYKSLVLHTDITHIKQSGIPSLSIIGFDDEPSYYNIKIKDTIKKSFEIFTKREKDILKCIIEGKKSKIIAEELYISLHTVNTHRKTILKKAICKNHIDLVFKSIKEGWI